MFIHVEIVMTNGYQIKIIIMVIVNYVRYVFVQDVKSRENVIFVVLFFVMVA